MNLHGILNKGQGRRRVERQVAMLAAIGVAMLGGIATAVTASANVDHKVWVCKYVGTPGADERLQIASADNQNPHSVDANSTDGTGVGGYFKDAQGQSFVLALNPNNDNEYTGTEPCPGGRVPIVTVTSEHATSCTEYSVRDVTTTIGWVEVDGQWVKDDPVITNGPWVNSVPTAEQLKAAGLVCTIPPEPIVTVTSEHATSCTEYSVRDVTTTIGWVEVDGQWVKDDPVITNGPWVNSVPTAEQLKAAGLVCTIPPEPIVTVTSEHATTCTEYSVRDATTTIGWVEVDGQRVKDEPVITNGPWVNSVPTAEQLKAAGLVCTIPPEPIVTVTSEHATSCTEYSVRDVTTTIGWVEVDGQWVKDDPVITNGPWVNSVPTAEQLKAAGLV